MPIEATVFDRWHVDYLALPEARGFEYILVLVDSFSLYSIHVTAKPQERQKVRNYSTHSTQSIFITV